MTPTPAETAMWRALNPETHSFGPIARRFAKNDFHTLHPADRLAYFEGKVRETSEHWILEVFENRTPQWWLASWFNEEDELLCVKSAPTEHLARFHAAARALNALGVIDDDLVKEIEDGND